MSIKILDHQLAISILAIPFHDSWQIYQQKKISYGSDTIKIGGIAMKKRQISIITALATAVISIVPITETLTANAVSIGMLDVDYEFYREALNEEHGLSYYVYSDHAILVNVDWDQSGVIIPESVKGVPVTMIADEAFDGEITTYISIPASVTDLGCSLGRLNSQMTVIINPENKNYVIKDDIIYTSDLTELVRCMPVCENEEITIPDTVNKIAEKAFFHCEKIKTLNIPASVNEISSDSLFECKGLESINVDENNKEYCSINEVLFNKYKDILYQYPIGKPDKNFIIPDSVDEIGSYAFADCDTLESIEIPDSVEVIGDYVFPSCDKLTKIVLPDSVLRLGSNVFEYCSNLSDITFSKKLKEIGLNIVRGTKWLNELPDGVVYIGPIVDSYKGNMPENTSLTIKEGTTCISEHAFDISSYKYDKGNDTLKNNLISVTLPESVKLIDYCAFRGCENLQEVNLPDSLTDINYNAFEKCYSLKKINLPSSLKQIRNIFDSCRSLEEIIIPENVTYIPDGAFKNCTSLKSITVKNPNCFIYKPFASLYSDTDELTVKFDGTIYGYDNSTAQEFAEQNGYKFESIGGYEQEKEPDFDKTEKNDTWEWCNCGDYACIVDYFGESDVLEIPNMINGLPVTTVYLYDAKNLEKIKSLKIPANTTGFYYFGYELDNISEIEVDKDNKAFIVEDNILYSSDKTTLIRASTNKIKEEYIVPETVTKIEDGAFTNCSKLKSVKIPASVENIVDVFEGCNSLEAINVSRANKNYRSINGILFDSSMYLLERYPQNHSGTSYTIPSSVTMIGNGAFMNCGLLENIVISDNVCCISSKAFKGCDKLDNVILPSTVNVIEDNAFENCSSLKSIEFSNDISSFGVNVMKGTPWYENQPNGAVYCGSVLYRFKDDDSELTEANIKAGTKVIADFAFCKFNDLNDYNISITDNTSLKKIVLPDSMEKLGDFAFSRCTALKEVNIPNGLNRPIGTSRNGIFSGCSSLPDIILSDDATVIHPFEFERCNSLKNIEIPVNISEICDYAFLNCESLESITIKNPDCKIYGKGFTICNSVSSNEENNDNNIANFNGTIYGYDESTAEEYAKEYGYNFKSLGKAPYKLGDVNNDGNINAVDASAVLSYYANVSTNKNGGFTDSQKNASDINHDGLINAVDASCILSYYAYVSTTKDEIMDIKNYLEKK